MIVRMVRRAARVAVTLLVSAGVVVVASSCGAVGAGQRIAYCAIMPDSVGLYVGNPVTQMGFQIGEVTSIVPSPTSVRVDFLVGDRSLPSDVKAVIRSTSILADRSLELVGNYGAAPTGGRHLHPIEPVRHTEDLVGGDWFGNNVSQRNQSRRLDEHRRYGGRDR